MPSLPIPMITQRFVISAISATVATPSHHDCESSGKVAQKFLKKKKKRKKKVSNMSCSRGLNKFERAMTIKKKNRTANYQREFPRGEASPSDFLFARISSRTFLARRIRRFGGRLPSHDKFAVKFASSCYASYAHSWSITPRSSAETGYYGTRQSRQMYRYTDCYAALRRSRECGWKASRLIPLSCSVFPARQP